MASKRANKRRVFVRKAQAAVRKDRLAQARRARQASKVARETDREVRNAGLEEGGSGERDLRDV